MKQLALDLINGHISLLDCPDPQVGKNELLIAGYCSLVSPGTERMLLEFGSSNWLEKARQQPEKLKQTIQKIKTDGLGATLKAVQNKLRQPMALGYSHVGRVVATGAGVVGFKQGDRVVSNGPHASMVTVPQNLCAKIPDNVPDEAAAFTVPGAIALQSIRLLQPTFGESIVVIGAGLIGQLTARLLMAHGCRVLVTDKQAGRLQLLPQGAIAVNHVEKLSDAFSEVDGVLITAATNDRDLANQCAAICRKRGRIILGGNMPIRFDRSLLYEKEISFQVSCSYGPGRYDPLYEQAGLDYPRAFVRWTAQRNFEAVLEALRAGQLDVTTLLSRKVPIAEAPVIYRQFQQKESDLLTALFTYPDGMEKPLQPVATAPFVNKETGHKIALTGAGQFTAGVILPVLQQFKAPLKSIAGKNGFHAAALCRQFQIPEAAGNFQAQLNDPEIGLVLVTTPHEWHAPMAVEAMQAGKDVFVEKPMAIDRQGLAAVAQARETTNRLLYVGYNRRFAPLGQKAKAQWQSLGQKPIIFYQVNAGVLPATHWLHQPESGGRLIGEMGHFIDFCIFLQDSLVQSVFAKSNERNDVSVVLTFENKAQAVIHYFSSGHAGYPKERIEMHGGGRSMVLDNWRSLKGYGFPNSTALFSQQDKGHKAQFKELLASWPKRKELIPFLELFNSTSATLAVQESLEQQVEIRIL